MENILESVGEFTWLWGFTFFIETSKGNFVWSDPDYGGDNTIKKYEGTYNDYLNETVYQYGRSKGKHVIKDYCPGAVLIE